MTLTTAQNFHDVYPELLYELMHSRWEETNQRTGVKVRVLEGAASFKLDLGDNALPLQLARKTFAKTAAAEVAWFLTAETSVLWLERYAKIWSKFKEDGTDDVKASYGYRWRRHFGRDQLNLAVEALLRNPTDRRVYVQAWDPSEDGLGAPNQKNVPCPIGFNFMIEEDRLHSAIYLRSSDVFVGLPYDVMGHAMLMRVVADTLKARGGKELWGHLKLGSMHVTLAHAHLYAVHYDMARRCYQTPVDPAYTKQTNKLLTPQDFEPHLWMPEGITIDDVAANPDVFPQVYDRIAAKVAQPEYSPKPELVL